MFMESMIIIGIISMVVGIYKGVLLHDEYLSNNESSSQIDIDSLLKKVNEANWCICVGAGLLLTVILILSF